MNRRDILLSLLALGAAARPICVRAQAQRAAKPFRIGFLPEFGDEYNKGIADAMRDLGWAEGTDYTVVRLGLQFRTDQIDSAASRMVAEKPDLILVVSTAYAIAVHHLSSAIPIVMLASGYPVEAGIADSLARPGKNVTGNTAYAGTGIWGKLVQLLQETKPSVKRIGVLWDYVPPAFPRQEIEPCYQELRQATRVLGLSAHIVEVAGPDHVTAALTAIGAERPDALFITTGAGLWQAQQRVMQFAVERRLPTITDWRWFASVEPYPLIVYAPRQVALIRQAASYIVRLLKQGAKAANLPIQQPATFELVVNLKTARAIGLTLPPSFLVRADEVIR